MNYKLLKTVCSIGSVTLGIFGLVMDSAKDKLTDMEIDRKVLKAVQEHIK